MLQRIQTVYLFLSALLLSTILFFPLFEFNTAEYVLDSFDLSQTTNEAQTVVFSTLPLAIIVILAMLLSMITIFFYKKRVLQMRLTIYNLIIILGIYILLSFYRFYVIDFTIVDTYYNFTLIFPIISVILTYMANSRIKKDEDLIRSVDRIR